MTDNPAEGGSYIRDPRTGALQPAALPTVEATTPPPASEPAPAEEDAPEASATPNDDAPARRKRG